MTRISRRSRPAVSILLIVGLLALSCLSVFGVARWTAPWFADNDSLTYLNGKIAATAELSAGTAMASALIAAVPDDATTPIADQIAGLSSYILIVSVVLTLEKLVMTCSGYLFFQWLVPIVCLLTAIWLPTRYRPLGRLALLLLVIGLCLILLVPLSCGVGRLVDASNVLPTMAETPAAEETPAEGGSLWDGIVGMVDRVANSLENAKQYAKDMLAFFMNSIVVLLITNFVIPLAAAYVFMHVPGWVIRLFRREHVVLLPDKTASDSPVRPET